MTQPFQDAAGRGRGRPGSAPPIRVVPDSEIIFHERLVHFVLHRMRSRGQIASELENDDLVQVGRWGLWEALRRWTPTKGKQSTYCSSYIWGYVMHYQRGAATRALGWDRKRHERIAVIGSYEHELVENLAVFDTLAAPDDTADQAHWAFEISAVVDRLAVLRDPIREIAQRVVIEGGPCAPVARDQGISRERVRQYVVTLRPYLAGQGTIPPSWRVTPERLAA